MCPPGHCQRGRFPCFPPFSTLLWISCVKNNCHCTPTGRKLRFWTRKWYKLPNGKRFYPVKRQSGEADIHPAIGKGDMTKNERTPYAMIELEPLSCGRWTEYTMSQATKMEYEALRRPYTCIVRIDDRHTSGSPPPYDIAVENRAYGSVQVVAEFY